jgi:hypothetical protein
MKRRTLPAGAALGTVAGPASAGPAGPFAALGHADRRPPHVAGFRLPVRPRPQATAAGAAVPVM